MGSVAPADVMDRVTLAAVLWHQNWTEAKTWAQTAPHRYVLDKNWTPYCGATFEDAKRSIQQHAEPRRWRGRIYRYFVWVDQQFWIMPYDGGLLINRADANTSEPIGR